MTQVVYYTATTLDGFIADEQDSLEWLFVHDIDQAGPGGFEVFRPTVGVSVMGATTFQWLLDHEPEWEQDTPTWVFTTRTFDPRRNVTFVSGSVADHLDAIVGTAGDLDVWVIGGGDLAGQFADLGRLDRVLTSTAPVTLGSGRPLLPRRLDLRLSDASRNGDFVVAAYDVIGARG